MTIQKHDITQGSAAWHKFRAEHFGASEASAMLGISPYTTRDKLLFQKKTGITQEVSESTQRVFDKGHAVEALARPIVEKMIGEDLSPVTFSNGMLSASCDGISFMGDVAWENKQMNQADYELVKNGELPEKHWPQCQQVLHCTGAEKLFFTISDGTEERTAGIWVYPNTVQQEQIINGWKQFKTDLDAYVPPVQIEKVEAETVQALPVPSVVVRGEITASNLSEITPKFDAYLSNIKTELKSDQDFADAEANAKNCRETAKRIEALQENIIGQMVSVNEVNGVLENYKDAFNKIGLQLEKAVKEQKESLKTAAIMKAKLDYADFVKELNKGIEVMLSNKLACPDFAGAIKNVKTISSMQSRINDALANGKTEATTLANDVKTKLAYINETAKGYEHLINVNELAFADIDYIKLYLSKVKADEDKRKADHEAAIKEKAEADARAKLEAEAKAKLEAAGVDVEVINHINESDFNKVFADTVKTGTGVMSVSVNENTGVVAAHISTADISAAQITGKRPTAQAIINLVATTYKVDANTASRWLAQSFGDLKAA